MTAMGKMTIADWCDGLREWAPTIAEPTLPYGMAECIGAGDCFDDGALRTDDGHRIPHGRCWLFEEKLPNAAYYGWRETGYVTVDRHGRTMYLVQR